MLGEKKTFQKSVIKYFFIRNKVLFKKLSSRISFTRQQLIYIVSLFCDFGLVFYPSHTVPKVIDFPRYNMKCSGENVILHGIFHVVSSFPLLFMLYRGYLDCLSNSVSLLLLYLYTTFCVQSQINDFIIIINISYGQPYSPSSMDPANIEGIHCKYCRINE